jgi:hypothetical protein
MALGVRYRGGSKVPPGREILLWTSGPPWGVGRYRVIWCTSPQASKSLSLNYPNLHFSRALEKGLTLSEEGEVVIDVLQSDHHSGCA